MSFKSVFKISDDQSPVVGYLGALSILMLIIAILPLPYGYYTLLRIVLFSTMLFFAYAFHTKNASAWLISSLFVAALYNPVIPVWLYAKSVWVVINVVTACYVYSATIAVYRDCD